MHRGKAKRTIRERERERERERDVLADGGRTKVIFFKLKHEDRVNNMLS